MKKRMSDKEVEEKYTENKRAEIIEKVNRLEQMKRL